MVVSAMLINGEWVTPGVLQFSSIAARDSESGEELPEGSDQLSSASMEEKHGRSAGHGGSNCIPVNLWGSSVKSRSFGSDTATVDGLLS